MHPRKLVRDSIGYATSQFIVRAAMIVRTVLAARWLGPQAYGAWNALQLMMDYGTLAPLGTQQGLDQRVPRAIVDGDPVRLARIKRAGFTNILLLTGLFCATGIVYLSRSNGRIMSFWAGAGMLVAMAVVLLINWANYHTTLLRSHGNIGAVSRWFFVQGMVGAVLGLALIPWQGAWGLLWGWLLGTLVSFAWTRWDARKLAPLRPLIGSENGDLLRVGFPLFFFLGSALVMRSLDRLIILRFLGTRELGYYSLAVTALTLLMYVPDSATYVLYPRLLQGYRAGGDQPEAIRDHVIVALTVLSTLTPALGGLAFLAARDLIGAVLPNYIAGATAVRVLCFGAAALTLSNLASIVLMTLGRQVWLIPIAVLFTAACGFADLEVLRRGYGISGVAWATLATYVASGMVVLALALAALGAGWLGTLRRLFGCAWALLAAIGIAVGLDRLLPWRNTTDEAVRLIRVGLEWSAFAISYALAVRPLLREIGLRQVLSEFNLPFASLLRRDPGGAGK
ncbi:MAG TPA: lipopolysaccharide biosynthesis protein [Candidatus Sulfotelmatobacter sp.]|nr:lipopolysaccharide biosynthesis protein [Candidatus Sulfotelmatobacter sp.]